MHESNPAVSALEALMNHVLVIDDEAEIATRSKRSSSKRAVAA